VMTTAIYSREQLGISRTLLDGAISSGTPSVPRNSPAICELASLLLLPFAASRKSQVL
jgi:hypothetical protein